MALSSPKTPPKGSRPPPKLPSDSAAWKPSLRGGETAARVLRAAGRRRLSRASRSLALPSVLTALELLLRDAKRRAGQDASSSSESMDDDDEGGGPAQGAPGETLYPFGFWDLLLL